MLYSKAMNFDIVVKQEKDGTYTVYCSIVPEIKGNALTVQEAMDSIMEPLVDKLGEKMKSTLRLILKDIASRSLDHKTEDMTLPISLN